VEEAALLVAMERAVGGVEIEHDQRFISRSRRKLRDRAVASLRIPWPASRSDASRGQGPARACRAPCALRTAVLGAAGDNRAVTTGVNIPGER
jgi:hypothetical protein